MTVPAWATLLLLASRSCTTGCVLNATPLAAGVDGSVVITSFVAPPAVAVAAKGTGEPVRPGTVAVAPCGPAVGPRTRVADAMPVAPVTDDGVIEPPPVTPHATAGRPTGLAARSVTSAGEAMGSGE